jgi:hypothetical protein
MDNLIKTAITFTFVAFLFYIAGSFAAWDLHPGNWSDTLRWLTSMWTLIIGAIISSANYRC